MFKLRQKLFITLGLVLIVGFAVPSYLLNQEANNQVRDEITSRLVTHIDSFVLYYKSSGADPFQAAHEYAKASGLRVTLVDKDGTVVGESNLDMMRMTQMDNHISRVEIQAAEIEGVGVTTRYSATLDKDFIYVAQKVDIPAFSFVRVAQTMDFVNLLVAGRRQHFINILLLILFGLLVSVILVDRWINAPILEVANVAKEIGAGNLNSRIEIRSKDEIGELAASMNQMAEKLEADITSIKKMGQVRSEFLGNVTHELKTPIASIVGYLETLRDGALNDENVNKSFINRSLDNAKRLEALVTDLVDISRIETGELTMKMQKVDINPILVEVVNDARQRTDNVNVVINLEINFDDQVFVKGDAGRLQQVFDNLISNAIQYTDKGHINISVHSEKNQFLFEITDTGLGIPDDAKKRIFERFYRTDKARDRSKGGTGLGLAITKHILEAHGSSVEVESVEGKGSKFLFRLDIYAEE